MHTFSSTYHVYNREIDFYWGYARGPQFGNAVVFVRTCQGDARSARPCSMSEVNVCLKLAILHLLEMRSLNQLQQCPRKSHSHAQRNHFSEASAVIATIAHATGENIFDGRQTSSCTRSLQHPSKKGSAMQRS